MSSGYDAWSIEPKNLPLRDQKFYESIFALGNGYMGVRGFDEEEDRGTRYELCTYIAGIFDYFHPRFTDMVNTPNFWRTKIAINGENFSNGDECTKSLNMREGTISRRIIWKDKNGNSTLIETVKFLSLYSVHSAVLRVKITPLDYDGEISLETGIDADVRNNLIPDDQMKEEFDLYEFLSEAGQGNSDDHVMYISLKTGKSQFELCEGFGINLTSNGNPVSHEDQLIQKDKYIARKVGFRVKKNQAYILDKFISVWTSRDTVDTLCDTVVDAVGTLLDKGFDQVLTEQRKAWQEKWEVSDIFIDGDDQCQQALRYSIFQLIQTNAENDPKVSIGARGVMHGRYKGCYFWDTEIFMFPFYLYTNPGAARDLLMYRYFTLPGAEKNARQQNVDGARFPWMSSIDGTEQCDTWDIGFSEVHITADIAYAVNQYYEVTGDMEFIKNYGLEMLIQTARYWRSRFTYDQPQDRFNMLFVKGPNEYGGVTCNNTYTTMMAIHNLQTAEKFISLLKQLHPMAWEAVKNKVNFSETEIGIWDEIIAKAVINYDVEKNLYIEDDNFFKLEPIDIRNVKEDDIPLYRKICFDRLQRYRVLKQADVLLLMLLLPNRFSKQEKLAAWNLYEPITTHDSSLSFGTHAAMAARLNLAETAYHYFLKSIRLDLDDNMENTGLEGIHFAGLGASWQAVINGFCGIGLSNEELVVDPHLPVSWKKIRFKLIYRNCRISFDFTRGNTAIRLEAGDCEELTIIYQGNRFTLKKGARQIFT
ncbi:MAG TPA: glycosyl hydrolase family 65 protein [Bacillota bacterium]